MGECFGFLDVSTMPATSAQMAGQAAGANSQSHQHGSKSLVTLYTPGDWTCIRSIRSRREVALSCSEPPLRAEPSWS